MHLFYFFLNYFLDASAVKGQSHIVIHISAQAAFCLPLTGDGRNLKVFFLSIFFPLDVDMGPFFAALYAEPSGGRGAGVELLHVRFAAQVFVWRIYDMG